MNEEQAFAIKCAFLDLQGSLENFNNKTDFHNWDAHEQSINFLKKAFPTLDLDN